MGAFVGCSSTSQASTNDQYRSSPTSPPVSIAATPSTTPSVDTTTTLVNISASVVSDCVAYVTYGAFTGNQILLDLWNAAGQDESAMRDDCENIGRADYATLNGMAKAWQDIDAYIAGVQAAEAAAAATTQPAPVPFFKTTSEPVYEEPSAPSGASAICMDGSYSYSQNRRGTCSHHGGVAVWL